MKTPFKKREHFLPFSPPLIGEEEKREMLDTLDSGWITTGPKTERFESLMCQYTGAKHALGVNSGTSALHLALIACDVGEGDEVIIPTYTFASTGHVVLYQKAKPVMVDVDPVTYNMSPSAVEAAITPKTKAILPVHFGGLSCDLDAIYDIARRHKLAVVEDAAHAVGTQYKGRKIGSFGTLTCFSFYATKNMTTGEGGMVVCNDDQLAEKMRVMSMYGISDARRIWKRYAPRGNWFYDISYLGYKYNMMDIQASLGIHQLAKLDTFIQKRTHFAHMYNDAFAHYEEITPPFLPSPQEGKHSHHLYPILLDTQRLTIDRDAFIEELKEYNIGTSVLFIPLHLHSFYKETLNHKEGDFPVSENTFERTIALPISPKMSDADVQDVIGAVGDIIAKHRK